MYLNPFEKISLLLLVRKISMYIFKKIEVSDKKNFAQC